MMFIFNDVFTILIIENLIKLYFNLSEPKQYKNS